MTTTYQIRMQDNPSGERNEFAVYFGAQHCGYGKTYIAAVQLAEEIKAKRQQAARCDCGSVDCPECSTGMPISAPPIDVAAGFTAMRKIAATSPASAPVQPAKPRRRKKAPKVREEIHETPMQNATRDELGISAFLHTCYEFVSGQRPAITYKGVVAYRTAIEALGPFCTRLEAEAAVNARCTDLVQEIAAHAETFLVLPSAATAEEVADVLAARQ